MYDLVLVVNKVLHVVIALHDVVSRIHCTFFLFLVVPSLVASLMLQNFYKLSDALSTSCNLHHVSLKCHAREGGRSRTGGVVAVGVVTTGRVRVGVVTAAVTTVRVGPVNELESHSFSLVRALCNH